MEEIAMGDLRIKRAYRAARRSDGTRVLVDALWPRGVSRERLRVDFWCKEVAPSAELRLWFGHDPARWDEFQRRYRKELSGRQEAIAYLRHMVASGTVTLIYAAKDETHNNAIALKAVIVSDY
jgi:uncharacterized protein YeaO (DUF488 family)